MLTNLLLTLIKINIMASIVAIVVLILKFVLKKLGAPRKLLFCLWMVIGLRFIFPDFIESKYSLFNLYQPNLNILSEQVIQNNGVSSNEILFDNKIDNIILNQDVAINNEEILTTIPTLEVDNNELKLNEENKYKITDIVMLVWICATISMILYAIISYIKLKKNIKFATKGKGNYYETDMISTPCVVGIIKPKIYLTLNLSEEDRQYILVHENIHIKRKDYVFKLIAYLVLSIHILNPLCLILFKLFINDMEMLCDEESIKKLGKENKTGYMESLINLSTKNMSEMLPCPIAFSENNTEMRVKNMINYKKSGIIISIVALILCLITTIISLTGRTEKNEILNDNLNKKSEYAEELYEYNGAYLGDAVKMRKLVSLIKIDDEIIVESIELDTETINSEEMGIYVNITSISGDIGSQLSLEKYKRASEIFLSLVKNADFIQYNYQYEEKTSTYKQGRTEIDLDNYTQNYDAFYEFIENYEKTLYRRTVNFLNQEFHRVYDPYYNIMGLKISEWNEKDNEATFLYQMKYLNYNRNPDIVGYIQEAKERSQEEYETLYNDYLALKESNYDFKVILNSGNLELYMNVSAKGEAEWEKIKIDDFVSTRENKPEEYPFDQISLSVVESVDKTKRKILNTSELHYANNHYDLYYYGLDEVNVTIDNKEISLENALKDEKVSLENIIKKARVDVENVKYEESRLENHQSHPMMVPISSSYDDGGTTEYIYSNYTIIKMNTLNGDRDVYICSQGVTLNDIPTDDM